MVHGVCQMNGRGLLHCIYQVDYTNKEKKKAEQRYGNTYAAVLKGDSKCKNLIAFFVYNTKPVYFLTMATEKVVWDTNVHNVWNEIQSKKIKIEFHCTYIQNVYNFHMSSVDIADQLQTSYGFQNWSHNWKW